MAELRIGYVVSRFPVLSETFVLRELAEIDSRPGVRCELFALFPGGSGPVHPAARPWVPRRRRATPRGAASALVFWLLRRPLRLAGAFAKLVRDYLPSPALLGRALVSAALALEHARVLRSEPVDHLHAHFATYPALAAWVCFQLTGIPYSFTAHAHDIFVHRLGLPRRVRDAAFCVAISAHNERILREAAAPQPVDVRVIHCGVHVGDYALRPRAPEPERPTRLVCVAAMKPYKGHRVLLDAVGLLAGEGVVVELDLVGDGPLRAELEQRCAQLGISERVHFLGAMTESEVAEVVDRADAFVIASVIQEDGDTDGIPVALMEAMAAGLPVIASDLSGLPELVRDGETGLLVAPEDPAALAEALRRLRADPDTALGRARAGRALIEDRFTVEGEASRLLEAIRDAAAALPAR